MKQLISGEHKLWIVQTDKGMKRTWRKTRTEAVQLVGLRGLKLLSIRPGYEADAAMSAHKEEE